MSDFQISQSEADQFFKEKKYRIDDMKYIFPEQGGLLNIPLKTQIQGIDFSLDIRRSSIYRCYFKRACNFCFNGPLFPSPKQGLITSNNVPVWGKEKWSR